MGQIESKYRLLIIIVAVIALLAVAAGLFGSHWAVPDNMIGRPNPYNTETFLHWDRNLLNFDVAKEITELAKLV